MGLAGGGGGFRQNGQKLHENDKIDIFVSRQGGDIGGQVNFSGGGGGVPRTSNIYSCHSFSIVSREKSLFYGTTHYYTNCPLIFKRNICMVIEFP